MTSSVASRDQLKRLRAESYVTREDRIHRLKTQHISTLVHYSIEELYELLPGRKIEWLSNIGHLTPQGTDLWSEHEAIVAISDRLHIDVEQGTITFQDREWSTRTIRLGMVFTLSVRHIPDRGLPKPATRRQKRIQMTRRVVVG